MNQWSKEALAVPLHQTFLRHCNVGYVVCNVGYVVCNVGYVVCNVGYVMWDM